MNTAKNQPLTITDRSKVKRAPKRASYDRDVANQIIDEAMVAYLGFNLNQQPFVVPTSHWRDGDKVYWHGASSGRMTRAILQNPICITFALLDGLVLARSAFHHSVNYRSVMLFGQPELVRDNQEKTRQLELFINHLMPQRWPHLRPLKETELKATAILSMTIDEGSAKIRQGGPNDDEEDYQWPVWAGVYPLNQQWGEAQPCSRVLPGQPCPQLRDLGQGG